MTFANTGRKSKAQDSFRYFVCFVGTIVNTVRVELAPAFARATANSDFHRGPLEHGINALEALQNFRQGIFGRFVFDKERPVNSESRSLP